MPVTEKKIMITRVLAALAASGGLALAAPAAQALAMPIPAVLPASPAAVMQPQAVLMPGTTVSYPSVLPAPVVHVTPGISKATASWAAIAGAAVYEVRAVPAGSGATTRVDHVTSARSLTMALHSGRYVVNVRAGRSASDIHGHWSASRYFTVAAPAPSAVYANPLRSVSGLVIGRIDEGQDFCGSGPLHAVGPGVIKGLYSGWPGGVYILEYLTAGSRAGQWIYYAESITPSSYVGEHVTSATVIGRVYNSRTCIEIGWGTGTQGVALASSHYREGVPTAEGYSMQAFLRSLRP